MAAFIDLEDSPMFHKQISSLEQTADELKDRCQKLYKGSKIFMASLGEACNGDNALADSLESSCGGRDDPVSLSIGGPVISKFISAFRELATYKELLRSQVEHVLVDRLMQFMSVDLQGVKDSRQRFNKSIHAYDQAREKFVSLKKGTREDVIAGVEEDLHNSKSAFERSRFSLVNALMAVEAKKKYEFLESFSAIMDAHLRYFKLGYDLLKDMEPLIHQVLTCAQQYKESASAQQDNLERRIQEFRTQAEMDSLKSAGDLAASGNVDSINTADANSYKNIQAIVLSTANAEISSSDLQYRIASKKMDLQTASTISGVHTIKQGYLFKQSSNLRGDRKRRFFVLDSQGTLYYYRTKGPKPGGSYSHQSNGTADKNGVFSRFRTKHNRTSSWSEESQGCRTVDLRTSTIKIDAEDKDLRLCFRIISPLKSYTLQAESEAERMDWVSKISGVITSLLNSQLIEQEPRLLQVNDKIANTTSCDVQSLHRRTKSNNDLENQTDGVSRIIRRIPGNDRCAECGCPEPDWASLNLGILFCIQCSSAHRNLGVHVSKVRSLTLDVKVWDSTIVDLFSALGNDYCNSVWEEQLSVENERVLESDDLTEPIIKPSAHDTFQQKEKYIQMKYLEKRLVSSKARHGFSSSAEAIWEAVRTSDIRGAYDVIAASDATVLNTTFEEVHAAGSNSDDHGPKNESHELDPATCPKLFNSGECGDASSCLRRCSILHLACNVGHRMMVELLLQFGADINMRDFHGRTPLHRCIAKRDNELAKYLLRRGAHRLIKDWGGLTALERAMELGSITDDELFILLAENQ